MMARCCRIRYRFGGRKSKATTIVSTSTSPHESQQKDSGNQSPLCLAVGRLRSALWRGGDSDQNRSANAAVFTDSASVMTYSSFCIYRFCRVAEMNSNSLPAKDKFTLTVD